MSATSTPFGFRPAYSKAGDAGFPRRYQITGGYGSQMLRGSLCTLNTNGTITAGAAATDILGVFWGCEYTDATGKPNESPFWPAAQSILSGTTAYAYVYDDPTTVFEVQADGSIPLTAIGDQTDVSNATAGSTQVGASQATVSATLAGAGVQGQFRIVAIAPLIDNAVGDAFTVVQVEIARHQYVASKVAI